VARGAPAAGVADLSAVALREAEGALACFGISSGAYALRNIIAIDRPEYIVV
jgi:hypothetical protein